MARPSDMVSLLHRAAPRLGGRLFPSSSCVLSLRCPTHQSPQSPVSIAQVHPPSNCRPYSQSLQISGFGAGPTLRPRAQASVSATRAPRGARAKHIGSNPIRERSEHEIQNSLRKMVGNIPELSLSDLKLYDLKDRLRRAVAADSQSRERKSAPWGRRSFFPLASSRSVGTWLYISAASVFGIVIFGGLTRMTESGLSITEWKPITGSLPPTSTEQWDDEFAKYRASPEFKMLNSNMQLDEFKKIYYMEYIHRLWGRVIGLSFVLPGLYFIARRRASKPVSLAILGISSLIGAQGFMGWYMVKSGLKDDLFEPGSHPRVSQYRLTSHLGVAFTIFSAMLWTAMGVSQYENKLGSTVLQKGSGSAVQRLLVAQSLRGPEFRWIRSSIVGVLVLVFVTAMAGGMVAGLDAGMVYNDFPWMTSVSWLPPKDQLWSDFYSRREDGSDLWWRNMLENPATVQLDHRILALTTFTAICALWGASKLHPRFKSPLPGQRFQEDARRVLQSPINQTFYMVWVQVTLGITTLLYMCPIPLASLHQAGALALLSCALLSARRVFPPRRFLRFTASDHSIQRTWSSLQGMKAHRARITHGKQTKRSETARHRSPPSNPASPSPDL